MSGSLGLNKRRLDSCREPLWASQCPATWTDHELSIRFLKTLHHPAIRIKSFEFSLLIVPGFPTALNSHLSMLLCSLIQKAKWHCICLLNACLKSLLYFSFNQFVILFLSSTFSSSALLSCTYVIKSWDYSTFLTCIMWVINIYKEQPLWLKPRFMTEQPKGIKGFLNSLPPWVPPIYSATLHWTHCLVWVSRVTWREAQAPTRCHTSPCHWNPFSTHSLGCRCLVNQVSCWRYFWMVVGRAAVKTWDEILQG